MSYPPYLFNQTIEQLREIAEADGFDRAVGKIFGPGRRAATAGYRFVHGLSPQTLAFRHRTALQTLDNAHDPAPEVTQFFAWSGFRSR